MEYAKEILQQKLNQLNDAYIQFVGTGKVKKDSQVAIDNRNKAKQLESAILCLFAVSNPVCPKCGDTGRCEPRTLSDPDGQECDCGANCC